MASKRKAFLSRSVSLSLAALIVLTGAMFLITTLEQDHQEWVLVEDQLVSDPFFSGDYRQNTNVTDPDFEFDFNEGVYSLTVNAGGSRTSSGRLAVMFMNDHSFDADAYKIVAVSDLDFNAFYAVSNVDAAYKESNLMIAANDLYDSDEGTYTFTVELYKQHSVDMDYSDAIEFYFNTTTSSSYPDCSLTFQFYELQDDNAGSVAAAITGLTLIVMGVFATPMLNVFRRR